MNTGLNLFIDLVPFVLYIAVLFKTMGTWVRLQRRVSFCYDAHMTEEQRALTRERRNTNLLMAIILLLGICTLTFMASNAYALLVYEKTFLSMRVFQMFVICNCAAYWLVLDLITRDTSVDD